MMELPKIKQHKLEKLGHLKFNNNFPTRDGLLLKSLQNENSFIKKKLAEFESRLDLFPIAKSYDKYKSQSTNLNNDNELPKSRKSKSTRKKRIDAFLSNQQDDIIETQELDEDLEKDDFKIPEKNFSRLNSARLNSSRLNSSRINSARINSSRINSARNDDVLTRLKSAQQIRERIPSAKSSRTSETYSTMNTARTNDSALEKIDEVLDNLKKHRRSAQRARTVEESIRPRPKTTSISKSISSADIKPESTKKKTRSKSAKKNEKKDDYQHMFYSNSWRIHSEFIKEEPDRKAPWDNTTSLFYKTNRKLPETFIFSPDWI